MRSRIVKRARRIGNACSERRAKKPSYASTSPFSSRAGVLLSLKKNNNCLQSKILLVLHGLYIWKHERSFYFTNEKKKCFVIDTDECKGSNPCQNGGTCQNKVGTYKCVCPSGYSGFNCEISKSRT